MWCLCYCDHCDKQKISSNLDFFVKSNDRNGIYNAKKKLFKKVKYWWRNDGFTFWKEVKITRLIDSLCAAFSSQFFDLKQTL